ncbi:MAG: hypothetical protein PHQ95_04465 [Candidatus Gracilibacteria bacterium]|nr:hypothetical protein [Candidatus Gracilibacteria bacterium]
MDINSLDNLISEFSIELDYENIIREFGKTNINIFIYEAYEQIKDMFVNQNSEEIQRITGKDPNEVEYTIFTNYLDNCIYYKDEEIETLFQDWRSKIGG